MKKILIASVIAAMAASSGAAFAQNSTASNSSFTPVGPYVKGEMGWVNQDITGNAPNYSKEHLGGRIAAGYTFDINRQFSVAPEIGYGYYGKESFSGMTPYGHVSGDAKFHAFDMSGVGTYHVNEKIDLFGKAGFAYKTIDVSVNDIKVSSDDNDGWTPLMGVGAGYNLTPQLQAQVTYTHMFEHQDYALDSVMAGLKYTF
ncbi:outer membrane beta-barrel protein [Dongshaea marina]|uniref:outer membrane beta-barrel protein n=1 Tax=Dongshaea marina TaxID=2047966 RepID=UPI000D3E6686|nr:outer membrane beta-barrel protein [Dongshaea marina]